jgi:CBS domain containing-hemolysin-like protein
MALSLPIIILLKLFRPMIWFSLVFNNFLKKQFRISERNITPVKSRDDISTFFLIGKNEGVIDDDKHSYVSDILSFKYIQAEEVMTPLVDIISIEKKNTIQEIVGLIEKTKFSRIPVFENTRDNITGYVHYKDIIKSRGTNNLKDIVIPPVYIPSTKNIFELYHEMHKNKTPLLFAVNEYGDIIGLLTFEDIAEEIVGEIHTDDHPDEHLILQESDRKFLVSGRIDIEYFQEFFALKIEKRNFETLAGFLNYISGEIPEKGDKVKYQDIEFTIEETGTRTVEKIYVLLPPKKRKKKIDN